MSKELYLLINEAQNGVEESLLEVVKRFQPLLKKYARKLKYEDAMQDLLETFLLMLPMINIKKNKNEGQLVNYVAKVIYHQFIKLAKHNNQYNFVEIDYDEEKNEYDIGRSQVDHYDEIDILNELKKLDEQQRQIIYLHFFIGYTIQEIADIIGVSRQAVNKKKNVALHILKENIWI